MEQAYPLGISIIGSAYDLLRRLNQRIPSKEAPNSGSQTGLNTAMLMMASATVWAKVLNPRRAVLMVSIGLHPGLTKGSWLVDGCKLTLRSEVAEVRSK